MSAAPFDPADRLHFYRDHLERTLLPFWMERAADPSGAGVFTCFDNRGRDLHSRDKYVWSQGRWAWMMGRLARLSERGSLTLDRDALTWRARETTRWLRERAMLDDGSFAYVLGEDDRPKEAFPGAGPAPSMFADAFAILGATESAHALQDRALLRWALDLLGPLADRMATGNVVSEPYPIPDGCVAHSFAMIMLNVCHTALEAARALDPAAVPALEARCDAFLGSVLSFVGDDALVTEVRCAGGTGETLLERHVNPGHALESMWFVLHRAVERGEETVIQRAADVIVRSLSIGWDADQGGLLRFVDRDGGTPRGPTSGTRMEALIQDTWDTKLWWPHSEALYATLLGYRLTGRETLGTWFQGVEAYVFRTFPNPDARIGEWIQIRDRSGDPLDKVVALPVKDPFHIVRNVALIIEALEAWP